MIQEYTPVEFKGFHFSGKTPYHYWVIKMGDGLYFKDYDVDGVKTTRKIGFAKRIARESFTLELIGFLQNFFDKEGNPRLENIDKTIPPIVGLAEAAEMLEWDKRKVSTYVKRGKFPKPIKHLASTPIWTYKQIEDFRDTVK